MSGERYNVIVLGAGSGGLTLAAGAAALGARAALLEKHRMGGDCLNYGCVPSKAFLRAARVAQTVRTADKYGIRGAGPLPVQDLKRVMDYVRAVRARIAPHDSVERFTSLGVDVHLAAGRLSTAHDVMLGDEGPTIWGRHIVLATGSRPRVPEIPGLREAGYLTNETIFSLTQLPPRLAVIGAGPIGCEMAQSFARFGGAVYLFESMGHVLPREDADAAEIVQEQMKRDGVNFIFDSKVGRVERRGTEKVLHYQMNGSMQELAVDEILVGIGRAPNVDGLGLESAGVAFDPQIGRAHV